MRLPLLITARGMDLTPAMEDNVRRRAQKLERFTDRILACRVVIEEPPRHHHKGAAYNVHIDLTVPGFELVVKREPNPDLYLAVRDAFNAVQRQLTEHFDRLHAHSRAPLPVPAEL